MHLELAEPATKRDVAIAIEVELVAKEDHLPFQQRRSDPRDDVVGHGRREVDSPDLGTDRRGQRFNLHASEA